MNKKQLTVALALGGYIIFWIITIHMQVLAMRVDGSDRLIKPDYLFFIFIFTLGFFLIYYLRSGRKG